MANHNSPHRALIWFRNDLRTHDHQALFEACTQYEQVIGCYVLDERWISGQTQHFGFAKTGSHRLQFILESLNDLRQKLRSLGSELYVVQGETEVVLPDLAKKLDAKAVFAHEEITDEELEIDTLLEQKLEEKGIGLYLYWGATLYHPDDIPFGQDEIPKVFTPFRKKVEKTTSVRTVIEQARPRVAVEAKEYQDGPIPSLRELGRAEIQIDARAALAFKGGETAALDRLSHYFFERRLLERYKETRNGLVGADYSSKFSPWLALGCLSPRYVYKQVKAYEAQYVANDSTYWLVFELLWRDFFRFVFWRHENALFQHKGLQQLDDPRPPRAINEEALERWRMGNTGIPFVDANMLELLHTGFMSNRGRQNVASYLVHVLGCDWRWGAEWFESQLVDYDPCSNWGNWAYIAGAGNDPRSRYFNVLKQANDYDPKGAFVRHWIPKLSAFGKDIHTPFRLSEQQWQLAGLLPDIDYPKTDLDPEKVYQKLSRHR